MSKSANDKIAYLYGKILSLDGCDLADLDELLDLTEQESFTCGALSTKQSPWISVEERLPETDDDLYIALDTKMNPPGCDVCSFNPQSKTWTDSKGYDVYPTHWMKIPE